MTAISDGDRPSLTNPSTTSAHTLASPALTLEPSTTSSEGLTSTNTTCLPGSKVGDGAGAMARHSLVEQWKSRIDEYIPEYKDEVEVVTYHSYHRVAGKEYALVIFDEVHHLPANTFIRLSTIKTKYRIGLSGSPFREDGRESYIFALTGFPVGTSWDELLEKKVVTEPIFRVYLLKNQNEKLKKLDELLKVPAKTIIFCDSIELGKKISRRFRIPFVYGETKDRMGIIKENQVCVVSRVGDEGISFPEIERVIEVAFLRGSRMQESQRFGRLMHSQRKEPEHIILMTDEEFQRYNKRLYAITERGFKIEVIS